MSVQSATLIQFFLKNFIYALNSGTEITPYSTDARPITKPWFWFTASDFFFFFLLVSKTRHTQSTVTKKTRVCVWTHCSWSHRSYLHSRSSHHIEKSCWCTGCCCTGTFLDKLIRQKQKSCHLFMSWYQNFRLLHSIFCRVIFSFLLSCYQGFCFGSSCDYDSLSFSNTASPVRTMYYEVVFLWFFLV